jgi:MFS family permease
MDHLGAVLGTLLASGLLWLYGASSGGSPENADKMRSVFLWAGLPGLVAMVCLARTVEPPRIRAEKKTSNVQERMSAPLKHVLLALTIFAFANATDAFLIVKAARLGASPALAPLLWLVLHAVKASTATAGGRLADTYGKRNSLVLGWLVYAALWAAIGLSNSLVALFLLTALYGTSHGLVEGAERGLIADLASGRKRGAAFGAYNLLIGMASLVASTAFGFAWDRFGSAWAFVGSAAFTVVASMVLLTLVPKQALPEPIATLQTGPD